jgi:hypothetical protein
VRGAKFNLSVNADALRRPTAARHSLSGCRFFFVRKAL